MIKRLILVSCVLLITQFTDARAVFHPIDDRPALTTLIVSKKSTSTQNNEAAGLSRILLMWMRSPRYTLPLLQTLPTWRHPAELRGVGAPTSATSNATPASATSRHRLSIAAFTDAGGA